MQQHYELDAAHLRGWAGILTPLLFLAIAGVIILLLGKDSLLASCGYETTFWCRALGFVFE
jgi:hypothetical protein